MSTMRIGGLASGMDIDSLVEKLMSTERAPLDKLEQQKQTYEWQRDAYRDVNTKLKTFDTYIADNLILKSLNTKTATSSNSNLVDVTATSAATGSLSIEGVSQLATAARAVGTKVSATGSTKMVDLTGGGYIELKAIQSNGEMAATATRIDITEDMTVDQFISKVNASSAGVSMMFENGQFSITAKNTGDNKAGDEILVESGADILRSLGFMKDADGNNIDQLQTVDGKNAIFKINGIDTERSKNNFTISGYSVTLKNIFNNTGTSEVNPVQLTSTTNVDEMIGKIKDFVTTYNGLITDLNNLKTEEKYRDYKPLTTEQREAMEESEIKLWEEKAKSGLLRGDSIIQDGLSSFRNLVYQSNPAISNTKYNTLFNVGITTSKDYMSGGTLEIDETKLRAALEADPDAVTKLFNFSGKQDDTVTVNGETKVADTRGFLQKLRAEMDNVKVKIEARAGRSTMSETQFTLGKYLKDVNSRITTWQDKLEDIESRYWTQFTRMETAINNANSQSTSLSSYFA